jgi:hypothetical protein
MTVRVAMVSAKGTRTLHDDAAREYAYGPAKGLPDTKLGAFMPALHARAKKDGWIIVGM